MWGPTWMISYEFSNVDGSDVDISSHRCLEIQGGPLVLYGAYLFNIQMIGISLRGYYSRRKIDGNILLNVMVIFRYQPHRIILYLTYWIL